MDDGRSSSISHFHFRPVTHGDLLDDGWKMGVETQVKRLKVEDGRLRDVENGRWDIQKWEIDRDGT